MVPRTSPAASSNVLWSQITVVRKQEPAAHTHGTTVTCDLLPVAKEHAWVPLSKTTLELRDPMESKSHPYCKPVQAALPGCFRSLFVLTHHSIAPAAHMRVVEHYKGLTLDASAERIPHHLFVTVHPTAPLLSQMHCTRPKSLSSTAHIWYPHNAK